MKVWHPLNKWLRIGALLFILSILVFFITSRRTVPLNTRYTQGNLVQYEQNIMLEGSKNGLNLPLFFFSLRPLSLADTLCHIPYSSIYQNLRLLSLHFGNGTTAIEFRNKLKLLYLQIQQLSAQSSKDNALLQYIRLALRRSYVSEINQDFSQIQNTLEALDTLENINSQWETLYSLWTQEARTHWRNYLPSIHWHGTDNQYMKWLKSIVPFLFAKSHQNFNHTLPLWHALRWTLFINFFSIIIILLISIPAGLLLGTMAKKNSKRNVKAILFGLYSIPDFWLATMLIVLFTSTAYCSFCKWFPVPGMLYVEEKGFAETVFTHLSYFILPFIVTTTDAIAYLTNQIASTTEYQRTKTYIQAAKAKGLSRQAVLIRHLAPNALFPLIVLLVDIIPGLVTGALVVEIVFNIPGMGRLLYESVLSGDITTIRSILLLIGSLTILGYVITDRILDRMNPTIKLSEY